MVRLLRSSVLGLVSSLLLRSSSSSSLSSLSSVSSVNVPSSRSLLSLLSTSSLFVFTRPVSTASAVSTRRIMSSSAAEGSSSESESGRVSPGVKTFTPKPRKSGEALVACYPDDYEKLLEAKVTRLRGLLAESIPNDFPVEVFESPRSHYRMR
jgi:hypothetical protein